MLDFLASETGLAVAWLLLALGAADLLAGWLWLVRGHGMEEAERVFPHFRRWLPAILALDGLLVLMGLYGLRLHGLM